MREPHVQLHGESEEIPYSALPVEQLRCRAEGNFGKPATEFYDPDFRRRYAAILLRERGL